MNWDAYKFTKRVIELEQVQKRMDDRSNLRGKRMSKQEYEQYIRESIDYASKILEKYSETPEQQQEFYNLVEKKVNKIKKKQNPEEKGNITQFFHDLMRQLELNSALTDTIVHSTIIDDKPSIESNDGLKNDGFKFEKSPADQVININELVYDAHPTSVGIDWNAKDRVPYPCDSLFASLGIYYDSEYGCWRLSEHAKKELERKKQVVTDYDEDIPVIEKPSTALLPQEQPVKEPKPTVTQKALFKGSNNPHVGGSEGITGQPGDQGKPNGLAGVRQYEGNNGKGNGTGYDLGGRGAKILRLPNGDFCEEGKIVVDIWVNHSGQVIRAEIATKSTNIINNTMRQEAIRLARQSTFTADPDAPDEQHGTITYTFVINQ